MEGLNEVPLKNDLKPWTLELILLRFSEAAFWSWMNKLPSHTQWLHRFQPALTENDQCS